MTHRIVVADDEIAITRAIALKLRKAGLEVDVANNGEEAWEHINRATPDLIITDYQMPRLNGLELCRRVRAAGLNSVPIILLTAKGFEVDHDALKKELGLSFILSKPFSPRELLRTAQQLIGDHGSVTSHP